MNDFPIHIAIYLLQVLILPLILSIYEKALIQIHTVQMIKTKLKFLEFSPLALIFSVVIVT